MTANKTFEEAAPVLSTTDYARAESFLPWNVADKVHNADVEAHWLGDGASFWYRRTSRHGATYVAVDATSGERCPAFDHARLAASLADALCRPCDAGSLPIESVTLSDSAGPLRFRIDGEPWECDLATYRCTPCPPVRARAGEVVSPDGRWNAWFSDHNLWVGERASGDVRRLTVGGTELNAYGGKSGASLTAVTDKLLRRRGAALLQWSPDSSRLVTFRLDERGVRSLHLQQAASFDGSSGPSLHTYRMPFPGDGHLPRAHLVIAGVAHGAVVAVDVPPLDYLIGSPFETRKVWWSAAGDRLYVLESSRDGKTVTLFAVDPADGSAKKLIEESGQTFVYPHHVRHMNSNVRDVQLEPTCRSLSRSGELPDSVLLWLSQADGWGHLYLHDGATGARLRQLTAGDWTVRDVVHADGRSGWIYFTAGGREPGRDPYYRHLYRARLADSAIELLTPEDADHTVKVAPNGQCFLDTYSRLNLPPVTVLRRMDGTLIATIETADISGLLEMGWRPPERFTVKARDGVTDLYGTITRPTHFDPGKKYPVLDSIYPGPQTIRVPKSFAGAEQGAQGARNVWQDQAIAELGFLVVNVDGMGTPYRSKAFLDVVYGANFGEAGGLRDHVGCLEQLAGRDPSFDLSRVGIFGHSAGAFASVRAMLQFPEFYKVAVASSGNHDQRGYWANWGEFYVGMPDGDNYRGHDNAALAGNLRGKLLLMHGDLDDNVHPAQTLRLADAFMAQNKDFDFLMIPFCNHDYFDVRRGADAARRHVPLSHPYFIRKRWDYFVTHLLGIEPPRGYAIAMA